jgi:hypothetical protein
MTRKLINYSEFNPVIPTDRRFVNLTGKQFGRLTVISIFGRKGAHKIWLCQCSCKAVLTVYASNLTRGHTQSCGCLNEETKPNFRHGGYGGNKTPSVEYIAYYGAIARCRNPNATGYEYWGGRGIEFRFKSFEEFLADVGMRPSVHHSLDREDVNGHYEPGNVRWVTRGVQNQNRRRMGGCRDTKNASV